MNKDVFSAVPVTFHIKEGLSDPEFYKFKNFYFNEEQEIKAQKVMKTQKPEEQEMGVVPSNKKNIWIIKPGENSNRGNGIIVAKEFEEIKKLVEESTA
mmetsp:Transcript_33812/g.32897  ORF Transcript_33812/g.32897 Transcript_33812/m.32897 type:complete len:98 (-) Transcript_33812:578-871(-)